VCGACATNLGMRRQGTARRSWWQQLGWLCALALLCCSAARAQVIEPNGLAVPVLSSPTNEVTLQDYFAGRMPPEPIDALNQASAEPATFSPRCGFEAELVLSQSSAAAGLAWYNVPADPSAAPDAIYVIVEETTQTGAVVSSSQIRSDARYTGGAIGFALTKFGGTPIYYSEASRNAVCTACVQPGPWKLMLAYPSPLEATTYYLAWEDWEGANENSWPDDGDFNDKVFRLSGVRCAGGGEPCETGLPGVCAQGLTGCSVGAEPGQCVQLEAAGAELCDGLDNDCDGMIDNDRPCGSEGACVNGACVQACGGVEFPCPAGQVCDDGECVDPACSDVACPPGQLCQQGVCRAPCEGVVCPLGQACRAGVCKDPCAAVSCAAGSVCRLGACLESCVCSGCPDGLSCDADSGSCVEPGCAGVRCPGGQACAQGVCVAACQNAQCPRGAACQDGQCGAEQQPMAAVGAEQAPVGLVDAGAVAAAGANSTPAERAEMVAGAQPRAAASRTPAGCGCQIVAGQRSMRWFCVVALGLIIGSWRRVRRLARSGTGTGTGTTMREVMGRHRRTEAD
jgi:hypothetical protein